jgi:hypothetical protein
MKIEWGIRPACFMFVLGSVLWITHRRSSEVSKIPSVPEGISITKNGKMVRFCSSSCLGYQNPSTIESIPIRRFQSREILNNPLSTPISFFFLPLSAELHLNSTVDVNQPIYVTLSFIVAIFY